MIELFFFFSVSAQTEVLGLTVVYVEATRNALARMWEILNEIEKQECTRQTLFSENELANFSCKTSDSFSGFISELFGESTVLLQHLNSSIIEVNVNNGYFPSLQSTPVKCLYEQCSILPGIECSSYLSGYSSCILCNKSSCSLEKNMYLSVSADFTPYFDIRSYLLDPVVYLFEGDASYNHSSPSVFGCRVDGSCVWIHDGTYAQHMSCYTGVCRAKEPTPDKYYNDCRFVNSIGAASICCGTSFSSISLYSVLFSISSLTTKRTLTISLFTLRKSPDRPAF